MATFSPTGRAQTPTKASSERARRALITSSFRSHHPRAVCSVFYISCVLHNTTVRTGVQTVLLRAASWFKLNTLIFQNMSFPRRLLACNILTPKCLKMCKQRCAMCNRQTVPSAFMPIVCIFVRPARQLFTLVFTPHDSCTGRSFRNES